MDRMTSNEDLLAYIQSPAGRRFLESGPSPFDDGLQSIGAPLARILWSVQTGLVLGFGGLGLHYAVGRLESDSAAAQSLLVVSILAVALGIGFILSAAAAYGFSQRLGLFERTNIRLNNGGKDVHT
jgi:hypothetical protein